MMDLRIAPATFDSSYSSVAPDNEPSGVPVSPSPGGAGGCDALPDQPGVGDAEMAAQVAAVAAQLNALFAAYAASMA